MTRYDKILVPDPKGTWEATGMDLESEPVETQYNVIVLTLEEALEMWNAGRRRQDDEYKSENLSKVTAPDFYTYLTSKGITI